MTEHKHAWHHAPDWEWLASSGEKFVTIECTPCRSLRVLPASSVRCLFRPCVATCEHYHGGGSRAASTTRTTRPGTPIAFVGPDPDPDAVRDYNGAIVGVNQ